MLDQANRIAQLDTSLGPNELVLYRFAGKEAISQGFSYRVDALSENFDVPLDSLLGQLVTVTLDTQKLVPRHFNGVVVGAAAVGMMGRYAHYQLDLRSFLWKLDQYRNCKIFQNQTALQIVEDVLRDRGCSDFKIVAAKALEPREYCVQYRETDLNFIRRLLEEEGLSYHFKHEKGRHELQILDSGSTREHFGPYAKITHCPPQSTGASARDDQINSLRSAMHLGTKDVALCDYDFEAPRSKLEGKRLDVLPVSGAVGEHYDYLGSRVKTHSIAAQAAVEGERLGAGFKRFIGYGSCEGVVAGCTFERVDENTIPMDSHPHLVLESSIEITQDVYESGHNVEEGVTGSFLTTDATVPYVPPYLAERRRVFGPQTATVVGPKGEEIYTDEHGRVKVQFHWDRLGKKDENSTCWLRVGTLWAGKGWGSMFNPRIGHEVIVDFLEGDPDKPLITGSVYNGDNKVPYPQPAEKNTGGIKSRSTKDGGPDNYNEIAFVDTKGEELFRVHAEKDYSQHVENDRKLIVGGHENVEVKNDDVWLVHGKRQVTIKDSPDPEKKPGSLAEESKESPALHSLIQGDEYREIEKNLETLVKKNETRDVKKNRDTSIGSNDTLDVGRKLDITAGQQITLKTGQSKIVMKSTGDIEISCMNLKIKANMEMKAEAGMKMALKAGLQLEAKSDLQVKIQGLMVDVSASAMGKIQGGILMIN